MSLLVVPDRHVLCPSWWSSVEDPYGVRTELPQCVSYLGLALIRLYDILFWSIVRADLAALRLVELIQLVRDGRLYW